MVHLHIVSDLSFEINLGGDFGIDYMLRFMFGLKYLNIGSAVL